MSVETKLQPAHDVATEPIEVVHIVCCGDENTALCATDVTEHRWFPNAAASCVVCVDLENASVIHCPLGFVCVQVCR